MIRFILTILVVLGCVAPVSASIAVVSRARYGVAATGPSIASPAQTHAAGRGLIVLLMRTAGAGDAVSTITNTAGDTFTQAGFDFVASGNRASIYYVALSAGNAADIVTVTLTGSRIYRTIVVYEVSGHNTTEFFHTSTVSAGPTSTTSISSGMLLLAAPEELIVSHIQQYPVGTMSAANGYTLSNDATVGDATPAYADEYKVVTASEAATATASTANAWMIQAASFKAAGTFNVCTQTLSPGANISAAVASVGRGATICLNTGDYGAVTFNGILRPAYVYLRPAPGSGAVTINPTITNSTYIALNDLTLTGGLINYCSRYVQVVDNTFTVTGMLYTAYSMGCGAVPANVLFAGNIFGDIAAPGYEGRLSIVGDSSAPTSTPMAITIRGNHFGPGCQADGVLLAGHVVGVEVVGNIFEGIVDVPPYTGVHCDSIQLYATGQDNIIRDNWFKDSSVVLQHQDVNPMASNTQFINNIISGCVQIQVGNSAGFVFEHNTIYNLTDVFSFAVEASAGVVYRSNILAGSTIGPPNGSATSTNNLCLTSGKCAGTTSAVIGTPTFAGGSPGSITTISGWKLAGGSAGAGAAHDGADIGVIIPNDPRRSRMHR